MTRWRARACGCLLVGLALMGATGSASACWNCSVWGCVTDLVGFQFCRTVIVFGQPTCFASGLCPPYPFGTGGAADDFAKMKRPVVAADPAAGPERGELSAYAITLPCARGCGVFEPGQTSRLVRGAASAGDAHAMLGALVRTMADPDPDLRIVSAEVAVGPGEYRGAFAGADRNGYALTASRALGGVEMTVCAVEAGRPSRTLAAATLGREDLLLVRVWLEDEECLLAWSAATTGLEREPTAESAAQRRGAFVQEAQVLTRWSRHRGFQLDALDPDVARCP